MVIEPISLNAMTEIAPATLELKAPVQTADFSHAIGKGLEGINNDLRAADQATVAMAAGTETSTHDVMIALSRARLDLQLVVQVRNRLMSAYQEISRMQV